MTIKKSDQWIEIIDERKMEEPLPQEIMDEYLEDANDAIDSGDAWQEMLGKRTHILMKRIITLESRLKTISGLADSLKTLLNEMPVSQ